MSAKKKHKRRLKKKYRIALRAIAAIIIAVAITMIAVNRFASNNHFQTLHQLLFELKADNSQGFPCKVIEFNNGMVANDEFCPEQLQAIMANDKYSGICICITVRNNNRQSMIYTIPEGDVERVIWYETR